jgi:ankyrin repeat protein
MNRVTTLFKAAICFLLLFGMTTSLQAKDLAVELAEAAKAGELKKVESCLKKKADVNAQVKVGRFKDTTALIMAATEGHLKVVQLLLNKKADLKLADKRGRTALSSAVTGNHLKIVKALLEKGADANATWMGMSMLSLAVRGKVEMIELLLDKGADINTKNDQGQSAFDIAVPNNNYDVIKLLIDRKAKIDVSAALVQAVSASPPSAKIIELFISQGADVNHKDKYGAPLLVKAANRNSAEVIALLLKKGADINATDKDYGRTALFVASGFGHAEVVKVLIKNKAKLNIADKYKITALKTATTNKRSEVIKLLKKAGAK